jgi:hypothetical protein
MFIELTRPVDCLRLRGPAGLLATVMDDLGGRLVASGDALQLTAAEFDRRLCDGGGGSGRFEWANDPPAPAQRDVDHRHGALPFPNGEPNDG